MDSRYFAYGSNLSIEQMVRRIGEFPRDAEDVRIARLAGYRLIFRSLEPGGPAYADIVASSDTGPESGVLGVVYRCGEPALRRLDAYERGYARIAVCVVDAEGKAFSAFAYAMIPSAALREERPSAEYLSRIVDGARRHGLPEPYVKSVLELARRG